ncbi:DUF58 domain-containing protein [Endozoicomonas sp. SCSIO W0465]|uniref:DUF58 domain-containing protein n=1 Tax=Endozoicomonas sp. SCSIO W0465 TaxID=2918516 RepID=UPI00207631F6|nr:DUF58 domain-containing protein [Endozoicomonas sp. SCSIO W0465]USE39429.1 DUF58 domain-containing protein [Endozoicomonas sp. SCSIO W0465]
MKDSLFTPSWRWLNNHFQQWADQRTPRATRIQLNQRRIYIVPTGSGFFWLSMVLVIFLVAVNYRNSLAYGLCFFMLSLFLLSILHTWRNLAGITLVAKGAEAGHAGEFIPVSIECLGGRCRRYSIAIGWPETESVLVSFDRDTEQRLVARAGSRGWFRPGRLRIESVYPLGLCRAWSWVRLDFRSVVYPAPDDRYPLPESDIADDGERSLTASGFDDFAGFRSYQQTDPPAHVFWQGYARTGELLTKQFDQPSGRELWFSLDQVPEGDLEQRLSVLTAWCLECDKQQYAYGLVMSGQKLAPSTGELHLKRCLEVLALYELDDGMAVSGGVNG